MIAKMRFVFEIFHDTSQNPKCAILENRGGQKIFRIAKNKMLALFLLCIIICCPNRFLITIKKSCNITEFHNQLFFEIFHNSLKRTQFIIKKNTKRDKIF